MDSVWRRWIQGQSTERQRCSLLLRRLLVASPSRCFVALAVSLAHILLLRGPQYLLHISFVSLVHHFLSLREERRD